MEITKTIAFILDVDGTLTDGKMYYDILGKAMKAFGSDDADALKTISPKVQVHFISGDERGFKISKKRADDIGIPISLVSSNAEERWKWIENTFQDKVIVFMGDGINDYVSLENANYSFTVKDALSHTKACAKKVIKRNGGNRAVAEACIILDDLYELDCFPEGVFINGF